MSYIQLAREQRCQIKALLKMGHNQTQIAKAIGVNKSTIGRELRRQSRTRRPSPGKRLDGQHRVHGYFKRDGIPDCYGGWHIDTSSNFYL